MNPFWFAPVLESEDRFLLGVPDLFPSKVGKEHAQVFWTMAEIAPIKTIIVSGDLVLCAHSK